ncbi:MAG: SEL1-like repeat protein [Alphaproteobacteria bacterium]|nr:SEL1-like repeat protein [Alphaproteobacteria bacterium]
MGSVHSPREFGQPDNDAGALRAEQSRSRQAGLGGNRRGARSLAGGLVLVVAIGVALDLERHRSLTHFNTPVEFEFTEGSKGPSQGGPVIRDGRGLTQQARKLHTGDGVGQDWKQALKLYRQAAALGDGDAMSWIGLMYAEGDGVETDPDQAIKWFKKAADAGDSDGLANLGWMYQDGVGIAQDYKLALHWFGKAADRGNAEAMNRLGLMHADGLGTAKNPQEAHRLFKMAADRGNSGGINNLAWLYRDGLGVKQDQSKARRLFEKAANMGNEVSAWCLAALLDEGKGGPAIPKAAAERLLQAAKGGQADAVKHLGGTMEHWSPATRIEVKRALAKLGKYNGALDGNWDEASRAAARAVMPG